MFKKFKIPYLNIIPVAIILMLLFKIVANTNISYAGIIAVLYSCIAYFVWGFVIAYLLNPLLNFFEKLVYKANDTKKTKLIKRGVVIAFIYLLLIGLLTLFIVAIVPSIRRASSEIMDNIPLYVQSFMNWLADFTGAIDPVISQNISNAVRSLAETAYNWLNNFMDVSTLQNAVDVVKVPVMGMIRFAFGFVVSIYFLFSKERLTLAVKKFLLAVFSEKTAANIIKTTGEINSVFMNYLISKVLQSAIMFVIGLIVLIPLNIPLAPFIALIIAVFNMIPYFGPYIGAIPCILIAWFYSPIKAFWVLLYAIGVQIIDNIFVGPKIVSSQVGISPLLVILGVTIGGQFGGVLGMFLGVPVVAVLKLVFYNKFIDRKLKERNIDIEKY